MKGRFYPIRLLTEPVARPLEATPRRSLVAVDGLVCGWCACRTARAFRALSGVTAARVDLAEGLATIEHEAGSAPAQEQLRGALGRAVIAGPLRRVLARAARQRGVAGAAAR